MFESNFWLKWSGRRNCTLGSFMHVFFSLIMGYFLKGMNSAHAQQYPIVFEIVKYGYYFFVYLHIVNLGKRLHDFGMPAWLYAAIYAICLIYGMAFNDESFSVGIIMLVQLIILLIPGNRYDNEYGKVK